jgi:hypothetical protein
LDIYIIDIQLMTPGHDDKMTTDLKHPHHLLPFYVNGSLDKAQLQEVEQHLASCERCRNEVAFLRKLRDQVKQIKPEHSPAELGLRRLLRDIKQEQPLKRHMNWWRPALAAAMLVIVFQAGVFLHYKGSSDSYQQLGGTEPGIQVMFRPTASEAQIQKVLRASGAHIIDGPSALGIYRIELQIKVDTPEHRQQRAELIQQLRQHSDVIQAVLPE